MVQGRVSPGKMITLVGGVGAADEAYDSGGDEWEWVGLH